jgi:hypothetical protein
MAAEDVADKALTYLKEELGIGNSNFSPRISVKDKIPFPSTAFDQVFVLIDCENKPNAYRDLCETFDVAENVTIFGFGSNAAPHISAKIEKDRKELGVPINFIQALSTSSDAADVQLTLFAGELRTLIALKCKHAVENFDYHSVDLALSGNKVSIPLKVVRDKIPLKMIIVTSDHFGKALAEVLKSQPCFSKAFWTTELYKNVLNIS